MSSHLSLAIVIVSYNVRDEISHCLRSLADFAKRPGVTITVVDNDSHDGTAAMLREQWPAVQVIESGANIGFAAGNNLGIRASRSTDVLLLNPDTVVPTGSITTLLQTLYLDEGAAAVGPRLIDSGGRAELSFGWTISPLGELRQKVVGRLYAWRVPPVAQWVNRWLRQRGPREWLSGACLLVRRKDLEAVGLLDERFFLYTEDVDLCVSLRKRGRRVVFEPAAEVWHLRGRSSARNPRTEQLRRGSHLAYYAKYHPAWLPLLRLYLRLKG